MPNKNMVPPQKFPPKSPPPLPPSLEEYTQVMTIAEKHRWFIGLLIGGLINTGVMWQQFQQLQKGMEDQKVAQTLIALKLSDVREKQIGGLQDVDMLKTAVKNLDGRVLVIERTFIERPPATTGK